MSRFKPRLTYANVMATVAVFVVLGGGAYATHSHKIATVDLKNGAVSTKKMKNGVVKTKKLAANAVKIGKIHEPLRSRWAVVHHNGSLDRTRGAVESSKVGMADSLYRVQFTRDVSQCSYAATITRITGGDDLGFIHARPSNSEATEVLVETRDIDGLLDPKSFSLQVFC